MAMHCDSWAACAAGRRPGHEGVRVSASDDRRRLWYRRARLHPAFRQRAHIRCLWVKASGAGR
eukprot:363979-Chlamydomonas_euryale.AAC.7